MANIQLTCIGNVWLIQYHFTRQICNTYLRLAIIEQFDCNEIFSYRRIKTRQ